MKLKDNLKNLRLQHNYTLEELADILGYKSYTTIHKWEKGVSEPPMKALDKLSKLYGVSMNDIANGYYLNDDTALLAEQLHNDPSVQKLFSSVRKLSKEDLELANDFIDMLINKSK